MTYRAVYLKTFFDNVVVPYVAPEGLSIAPGEWCLVNSKFGEDLAQAVTGIRDISREKFHPRKSHSHGPDGADTAGIEIDDKSLLETKTEHVPEDNVPVEHLQIIRKVTPEEVEFWQSYRPEEKRAFESARREIRDLGLDMKLVNVHFMFQKKKIIFNFTADNRIDFRQLVKRLAGLFRTRIEMRQIGVRDAAKVLGGYGVCGVENCCQRSNCHVQSIYLKMAKDQGFVVNSSKLTGSCGRLMCCLSYEMQFYATERRKYPDPGSRVNDGTKEYVVISQNLLTQEVTVMDENHHQKKYPLDSLTFQRKDILSGTSYYRAANTDIQEELNRV